MKKNSSQFQQLKKDLYLDEGKRNTPYKDSKNFWTIGVGFFIGEKLENLKLSDAVIDLMLEEKLEKACSDAVKVFGEQFESFTDARKNAIVNLIFNMGLGNQDRGFLSFVQTIPYIKQGLWHLAARNLSKSLWALDVDPLRRKNQGRDDRIVHMIESGEYHPEYLKG